jgi:hypothetical protein
MRHPECEKLRRSPLLAGSALCIVGKVDWIGGREMYRARGRLTERTGPLALRAQA